MQWLRFVLLGALLLPACITEPAEEVPTVYGRITAPPKAKKLKAARKQEAQTEVQTSAPQSL
jgi:hypothetical protein